MNTAVRNVHASFRIEAPTVLFGDVDGNAVVNLLDVAPFVDLITSGAFQPDADVNQDAIVDMFDDYFGFRFAFRLFRKSPILSKGLTTPVAPTVLTCV